MPVAIHVSTPPQSHSWRQFFAFLVTFFVAFSLGGLVPTPGSWSDVQSQWLDATVIGIICIAFLVATAFSYWVRSTLSDLQATLLTLIFGAVLVVVTRELYASAVFLRHVRGNRDKSPTVAKTSDAGRRRSGEFGLVLRPYGRFLSLFSGCNEAWVLC